MHSSPNAIKYIKNNIEKSIKARRYFLAGAFIFLFIAIKMPLLHFLSNYFIYIDFYN